MRNARRDIEHAPTGPFCRPSTNSPHRAPHTFLHRPCHPSAADGTNCSKTPEQFSRRFILVPGASRSASEHDVLMSCTISSSTWVTFKAKTQPIVAQGPSRRLCLLGQDVHTRATMRICHPPLAQPVNRPRQTRPCALAPLLVPSSGLWEKPTSRWLSPGSSFAPSPTTRAACPASCAG
jgi:hypothetical protein